MSDNDTIDHEQPADKPNKPTIVITKQHLAYVKVIAGRLVSVMHRPYLFDDMVSAGNEGLYDASRKFNPTLNIKWSTYAKIRIRGAMLDELRALDPVGRAGRMKQREIFRVIEELTVALVRPPTHQEIADNLFMPLGELEKSLHPLEIISYHAWEDLVGESADQGNLHAFTDKSPGPSERVILDAESQENIRVVDEAMQMLDPVSQHIARLYYFEELTCKEIALALAVTDSRISQVLTKLRRDLGPTIENLRSAYQSVQRMNSSACTAEITPEVSDDPLTQELDSLGADLSAFLEEFDEP